MSEFRRKIMMASGGAPKGTPLAWIQSNGKQLIPLPTTPSTMTKLLVTLDYASVTSTYPTTQLFGTNSQLEYRLYTNSTLQASYLTSNTSRASGSTSMTGFRTYGVDLTGSKGKFYVGGSSSNFNKPTALSSTIQIGLFASYRGPGYTVSGSISAKVSKVEINDSVNGTITLLPYLTPDGVPGLYDVANDQWYFDIAGKSALTYSL